LVNLVNIGQPILALCVSPVVIAKAFENSNITPVLTIGSRHAASPYAIDSFQQGLEAIGVKTEDKLIDELLIDYDNRIITTPCYMMDAKISEIRSSIKAAVEALNKLCNA
jgi:enhancing lycopene biosynthesis protein 2